MSALRIMGYGLIATAMVCAVGTGIGVAMQLVVAVFSAAFSGPGW